MRAAPDRRLRILTFTTLFPNPEEPARGIFVRNRLAAIAAHADVVVAAPVNAGRNPRVLRVPFRRRDDAGFEVLHPRFAVLPRVLKSWDGTLLYRETAARIRDAIDPGAIDLIDAHYAYPDGAAAARLAEDLGVPFVLTVRGSDLEVIARDPRRRSPIQRTLRRAAAIIAVSRSLAHRAEELGAPADRIHVVPNGIDPAIFHPLDRGQARATLGIPERESTVLAVARLDQVKGLELLVHAMAALRRRAFLSARAHVVGDGPERRSLEALIARTRAPVRLHGALPPETLPIWYAAADVTTLTSTSEGCPNSVLEALACGRPVVATAVGGVPDLVRDGENGFLVRERDPGKVADRIEEALGARWNHDHIATRSRRSWATVAEEQLEIYRRVSSERASGAAPPNRAPYLARSGAER
jgi:glycosyltransferase involved in cell wall biosynthesis